MMQSPVTAPDSGARDYTVVESHFHSRSGFRLLNSLACTRCAEVLHGTGVLPAPGERLSPARFMERLSPLPVYSRLSEAVLELLIEQFYLKRCDGELLGLRVPGDGEQLRRSVLRMHPDLSTHVELIEACVSSLPDVINGSKRAMDTMFPRGSMSLVDGIYKGQEVTNYYNRLLAEKVCLAATRLQAECGRTVNILEIGAGTGGSTEFILPMLQGCDANYFYTDVSTAFLSHGKECFARAGIPVNFELLDINKSLEEQDAASRHYDVVLATMVLHVAPDLKRCLENLQLLMRSGSELFVNEVTENSQFLSLTFGLLPDWWAYDDGARRLPYSPLLGPEQWRHVLSLAGYEDIVLSGIPSLPCKAMGQCIIAGRSPI